MRALVVDDNLTNRRILESLLAGWGMKPTLAADGSEALRILAQAPEAHEPFTLVLTDAAMPEMDGFQLAEQIRKNPIALGHHDYDADFGGTARRRGPLPRTGAGRLSYQAGQSIGIAGSRFAGGGHDEAPGGETGVSDPPFVAGGGTVVAYSARRG